MSGVTIYHNPDCGTSRNTLALIRNAGIEPVVIDPPPRLGFCGVMLRDQRIFLRTGCVEAEEVIERAGTRNHSFGVSGQFVHLGVRSAGVALPDLGHIPGWPQNENA